MTTNRTREIDSYTDDGQRWPIYEYVNTEAGEATYRTPAGQPVKKLSETDLLPRFHPGFWFPGDATTTSVQP